MENRWHRRIIEGAIRKSLLTLHTLKPVKKQKRKGPTKIYGPKVVNVLENCFSNMCFCLKTHGKYIFASGGS
jgi:hypothetical protein